MLVSPAQAHHWEPVVLDPLDEPTAYGLLDVYYQREADRQSLSETAGIDDEELLDRLLQAGFTPETLPALRLAPIAMVAWASNTVTDQECQAAVWSIYESRMLDRTAAAARVQSWIDVRPDQELWDLWVDFTECRLQSTSPVIRRVAGKQLLEQATAVALASGGYAGFGSICAAEQTVLDTIRNVYRI